MTERTILLVDDEPHVLNSLKRLLRQEGYTILTAASGRDGLDLLEKNPVQLIVSDQRMPEMTGTEFLQRVKARFPDTLRVVLSGYADVGVILDSINKGEIYRFLTKPWNDDELKVALRQCLAQYDLVQQNKGLMLQIKEQNEELKELNDSLEQAVTERTRSLQLSQEILQKLPIAVVGIGADRMVVLVNDAAGALLPNMSGTVLGADIRAVLPEEAVQLVERCLTKSTSENWLDCCLCGRGVRMQARPLGAEQHIRGCILIIEGKVHGH